MRYRIFLLSFLAIIACGASLANGGTAIKYVGSFSILRLSPEHAYISEVWLWRHNENVVGLYLNRAGLQGGGLPVLMHKIRTGRLASDGSLTFETKWYHFQGSYLGDSIKGKLVQGTEVIWGGTEGSDEIELIRGSNVKVIRNPSTNITRLQDLNKWVDALPRITVRNGARLDLTKVSNCKSCPHKC